MLSDIIGLYGCLIVWCHDNRSWSVDGRHSVDGWFSSSQTMVVLLEIRLTDTSGRQ